MTIDASRGIARACVPVRHYQKSTRDTLLRAEDRPRLKPIATKYDGYYFRSLTEARFAVLWNTCYWPYEFERQGFALESGAYRPDFYFPNHGEWLEVKGLPPTMYEEELARCLATESRQPVAIAWGQPDWATVIVLFSPDGERVVTTLAWFLRRRLSVQTIEKAIVAARSERFNTRKTSKIDLRPANIP
jgi:hypothetical protein